VSDFLLEFFSEEIPARMQARAEADLERLFTAKLKEAGLGWSALETFSGPRRIGLSMTGLPDKTEDVREERKGPRTDAPEKALQGFLRGAGLTSVDQCKIEEGKKGAFYVAVIEKPGRRTADVLAEAIPEIVKAFPWPKSMKFGEGDLAQRWVRPLQRIVALLDGEVVETGVFGLKAFNITEGHRVHGSGPFEVTGWDDYQAKLKENGVLLMRSERRAKILLDARKVCADSGLVLVEDDGLLDEVTGLVEHPCAILGDMDPGFLDLPPEVIQLTMKTHQKYFAVADSGGKITSKFVVIANQEAPDGGAAIAAGNARVLSARLSDARHFWDLDRAKGLEAMAAELSKVTFHEKLGTVAERAHRLGGLAGFLANELGADADKAVDLGRISKADLVSQMVYEFPELQGLMAGYYWAAAGGSELESNALKDQYKPQGPSDELPASDLGASLSVADKLDTLVGFFSIEQKPTGSKDPFALRRSALGIIRILIDRGYRINLRHAAAFAEKNFYLHCPKDDLLAFFADRLKVHLKDEGVRHDVIDAVFALGDDDLVRVANKSRALQAFLETEDGAALLAGYRRAANILSAEEKKGFDLAGALSEALPPSVGSADTSPAGGGGKGASGSGDFPPPPAGEVGAAERRSEGGALSDDQTAALLIAIAKTAEAAEERTLISEIQGAEEVATKALADEDFEAAMAALSKLRLPVDAFFEAVVVNAQDPIVRRNRLLLLSRIRAAVDAVADFSKLEG